MLLSTFIKITPRPLHLGDSVQLGCKYVILSECSSEILTAINTKMFQVEKITFCKIYGYSVDRYRCTSLNKSLLIL